VTPDTARPVVEVSDLTRRFDDLEAVRGVSFDVHEGEIFGFLGPNGAGKSTTINMLCTLLRPTSGHAGIAGYDVTTQESDVRRSIGLVFQETTLDERLSAEQNMRFHGMAYGMGARERKQRTDLLLEMVELADRRTTRVDRYSGGMKRRLEIARGLLHRPRVLFLDEPTLGLDPQTRRRIWDYLLDLRDREGLTVFVTTHYMDEAEHADRIAVIDHGRIVALDSPSALKASLGGDRLTLSTADDEAAAAQIGQLLGEQPVLDDDGVIVQASDGAAALPSLLREMTVPVERIEMRRPTLDDVFLAVTGRQMRDEETSEKDRLAATMAGRMSRPH
jgi:ABC-2 type transport system ATP-binding protein